MAHAGRYSAAVRVRNVAMLPAVALAVVLALLGAAPSASAGSSSCPNEAIRVQQKVAEVGASTYLPECRAYERASPAAKNGQELGPPNDGAPNEIPYQPAVHAAGVFYILEGAAPGSESGAFWSPSIARLEGGEAPWTNFPEAPTERFAALPPEYGRVANYAFLNPELTCGIEVTALPQPAYPGAPVADVPPGEEQLFEEGLDVGNIYTRNFLSGDNVLVTSEKPREPQQQTELTANYHIDGVSADCKHVLFQTEEFYEFHVTPKSSEYAPVGSLYEWNEGSEGPQDASVLPSGEAATNVVVNGQSASYGSPPIHDLAVEDESTRAFFTASTGKAVEPGVAAGSAQVFMRLDGKTTVSLSASKTSTPDRGAFLEESSADGSRGFFIANYGLVAPSGSAEHCENAPTAGPHYGEGCDLYEYHVTNATTGAGTLTDLSGDPSDASGASVRGVVGSSEDGTVVYFSATGQLVAGKGNSASQNAEKGEANVYAAH